MTYQLYMALMSWAVLLSGYPAPASPPQFVTVNHAYLVKQACGGKACAVLAWFPGGNTIYLDRALDPSTSLYADAVVVHEMVHYLQQESGRFSKPYSCPALIAMEREAYSVQREFFVRYGVYQPVGASMHDVGCEETPYQGLAAMPADQWPKGLAAPRNK